MADIVSPGDAFWAQRRALAESGARLATLLQAIDRPHDLSPHQWSTLFTLALQFAPDLVLELGRGFGNSTCVFTEAVHRLGTGRVVSVCLSTDWSSRSEPRVRQVVPATWFERLEALEIDLRKVDYERVLAGCRRVLVFWDAHGYAVAECVLGHVLPLISELEHVVVMHDVHDRRFVPGFSPDYGGNRLWRQNTWDGASLLLGDLAGSVEQLVAILDFASRNELPIHPADETLRREVLDSPERVAELERSVGPPFFDPSMLALWVWFALSEAARPHTFPGYVPLTEDDPALRKGVMAERILGDLDRDPAEDGGPSRLARLRIAAKLLTGRYER